ncbi:MAG: pyruvate carboxylase subunit B [Candidatus Verstraetearchaeota archaeon]|nr:pyruvate carboxylase subunit B [Candidatus Verstraetearchaeota archaeon]
MVEIVDVTLRDAHQSLLATRFRTEDMLPILDVMDDIGFYSMEVWGGATFDVPLRYLNEDPWVRLKLIRERVRKTKLQMLLRGQNLVGYRHYPDDICVKFVEKAFENGIDVFRIFDALNDLRNVKVTVDAARRVGAEIQLCMVYTVSPIHTLNYYLSLAREIASMEVDSICIKDMSGILKPYVAYELVKRIKSEVGMRVDVHSHTTAGFAPITIVKAIEAGADYVDCALSSMSMHTSHPPLESIVSSLEGTPYEIKKINLKLALKASKYFWEKRKKYSEYDYALKNPPVDASVLEHQIPGGMLSNLLEQLRMQGAEDRLDEVLMEVPRVRRDLGYPPLVTPLSQIVGAQAVVNVLSGKPYSTIIREVRDYVKGLYGKPPAEINPELIKLALGDEKPITVRPAEILEPAYNKIVSELPKELVEKDEDYITYALFPDIAIKYFKYRENLKKLSTYTLEVIVNTRKFNFNIK